MFGHFGVLTYNIYKNKQMVSYVTRASASNAAIINHILILTR